MKNRLADIFLSAILGMVLIMGLFPACPVYAAGNGTQKIRLSAVDDWDEKALTGAQFTLAVKTGDSYVTMKEKAGLVIPSEGLELELVAGEYRLTVDKTPGSYLTSGQPIEFRVTEAGASLISSENARMTEAQNGICLLQVYCALDYNNLMLIDVPMPSTGGGGTLPFTVGGLLLMAAAVTGGLLLRRRKTQTFLLAIGAAAVTAAVMTPISARAAEAGRGTGYTYYVMMRTFDGEAPAEYYVENERLADALGNLTVGGETLFNVAEIPGESCWYVSTSEEASDCTATEVAAALGTIREEAIESGALSGNTLELGYGALVLVKTKAGTYFVVEVTDAPQSLFGRPASVEVISKTPKPEITKMELKNSIAGDTFAIGDSVSYVIEVTDQLVESSATETTLHLLVPEGLTLESGISVSRDGNEISADWTTWSTPTNNPDGTREYTMSFPKKQTREDNVYAVSCTLTMNEDAGVTETISAYLKYKNDLNSEAETGKSYLNFYTFGFDLNIRNGLGEPLSGVTVTLQNAEGSYYTSPTSSENKTEKRFQPASAEVTTAADGTVHFRGLAAGSYTLTETAVPDNYHLQSTPTTIVVATDGKLSITGGSATKSGEDAETGNEDRTKGIRQTYRGTLTISNTAKTNMPSTGGNGTIIFYVVGGSLVLGAGMLLTLRRRV